MWQPQGIYNEYVLRTPALIVGNEAVLGLYNYPATKIAVIHGASFHDQDLLRKTFKKKEIAFFHRSWREEPNLESLRGTLQELETFSPDTIIAVGGGSVIDGTKLCRLFFEIPYFIPGNTKLNGGFLKTRFIAIPTTVGTGAEISSAAVYIEKNHKEMVVLHELQPDVIIYDKRYIENTPEKLLCASSMDAMAHIIEGYISMINNTFVEYHAEEALRILRKEFEKYLNKNTMDYSRLQYAGYLGGIVQNHCIVGAVHAVAHQLTEFGFSHGEAVALLLPSVINLNAKEDGVRVKYEALCEKAGYGGIVQLINQIESVINMSGIEKRRNKLRDILISHQDSEEFIANIKKDRGGKGNPIEITDDYITELIRSI